MFFDLTMSAPGSRAQESEADHVGLLMMAKACYGTDILPTTAAIAESTDFRAQIQVRRVLSGTECRRMKGPSRRRHSSCPRIHHMIIVRGSSQSGALICMTNMTMGPQCYQNSSARTTQTAMLT